MNIGIVTTWFERGAAYVSKQFMDALEKEFNVFIYARGGESYATNDINWNNEKVHWGKRNQLFVSFKIDKRDFVQWIHHNSIDIILFNEQQVWTPLLWCLELGVKTGAYIDYYTKQTVELFNIYDFVICNTKRHYGVFKEHEQSYYIPWGTDIDLYKPHFPKSIRNVFFHSAGMNPYRKGSDIFLKALFNLKDAGVQGVIHTQVDLRAFFPELRDVIDYLQDHNLLEIIQKTVTAPGLYYLGDVYIYPTRLEGIGLTIAEALSSGLPVITANAAPMSEFVVNGKTGYLISIESVKMRSDGYYWPEAICSVEDLTKAMMQFHINPSLTQRMSSAARSFAIENLDWEKNSAIIRDVFREVTSASCSVKRLAAKECVRYEKNRPFSYFLNTFKPYIYLKRRFR